MAIRELETSTGHFMRFYPGGPRQREAQLLGLGAEACGDYEVDMDRLECRPVDSVSVCWAENDALMEG